jgi:hypothetical protein
MDRQFDDAAGSSGPCDWLKIILGDDNVADLSTSDGAGIWGGRKGEMVITKLDENIAEGNFFFTGSSSRSAKTMEVTNGSFRIPLLKK